jgi:hypothetical protein
LVGTRAGQDRPGLLPVAKDAITRVGGQLVALAGQHTAAAQNAGALLSQSLAKLDRAAQAYMEFQRQVLNAAQAAQQAAEVVTQAARYHAAG